MSNQPARTHRKLMVQTCQWRRTWVSPWQCRGWWMSRKNASCPDSADSSVRSQISAPVCACVGSYRRIQCRLITTHKGRRVKDVNSCLIDQHCGVLKSNFWRLRSRRQRCRWIWPRDASLPGGSYSSIGSQHGGGLLSSTTCPSKLARVIGCNCICDGNIGRCIRDTTAAREGGSSVTVRDGVVGGCSRVGGKEVIRYVNDKPRGGDVNKTKLELRGSKERETRYEYKPGQ